MKWIWTVGLTVTLLASAGVQAQAGKPATKKDEPAVDPELSRKVYDETVKFLKAGEMDKATRLLEEWLRRAPLDVVNRRNLIHIYLKMKDPEHAELHLKLMTKQEPDNAEWWAHLARAQVTLGKYAQAVEGFEKAVAKNPGDLDLRLDLARTHARRKQWEEARQVLADALALKTRVADVLRELAPVQVELGKYRDAVETYRHLQRLAPSYATALTMAKLAARNQQCDDVIDALADWEKSFASEEPLVLLGSCALEAENPFRAEKFFKAGLEINPKCFECALRLGDLYFQKEDWKRAIANYAIAAPLQPRDFRAFNQLGKALANSGNHLEAARAFKQADERKPNDPEIVYMWGVSSVRAGQKAQAWDLWGRLEELDKARAAKLRKLLTK